MIREECRIDIDGIKKWLDVGYTEIAYNEVKEGLNCMKEQRLDTTRLCDQISNIYLSSANFHTNRRDWLLSGQILFDLGRIELLCGRSDKAYEYLLKAGESFSNSPRLYRFAASAYISGIAIAKRNIDLGQLSRYVEKAQWWLDWEAERYKLARDNELLAQTHDDIFLLNFILDRYDEAVRNLEKAAQLYKKLRNPIYKSIAALRYSFVASIQRSLTEELGWSRYNRMSSQAFEEGGDSIAASIEALKLNIYISMDKASIENIVYVAQKISESVSHNAAFSLLLTVLISSLEAEYNQAIEKLHETILSMSEKAQDIKLSESIKLILASKYNYSIEIDHLGRYKLVGDRWVRI